MKDARIQIQQVEEKAAESISQVRHKVADAREVLKAELTLKKKQLAKDEKNLRQDAIAKAEISAQTEISKIKKVTEGKIIEIDNEFASKIKPAAELITKDFGRWQ